MSGYVKNIYSNFSELSTALTSLGFTISSGQMRWHNTPNSQCYWTVDTTNGIINFRTSTNETAFQNPIVDFSNFAHAGLQFIDLENGGCILYLTPLSDSKSDISDLKMTCANNYDDQGNVTPNTLVNGLIVCTPAEADEKWRYSWRDKDVAQGFRWDIDNTNGAVTKGVEFPVANLVVAPHLVTLQKVYLNSGIWSENIYSMVLGEVDEPIETIIFKINGQKFIRFTDNTTLRCPVFKLPIEQEIVNDPRSTEEYSPKKVYHVGDYCIHEGLLYKCVTEVSVPTPFDSTNWIITTVYTEKNA